MARVVIFGCGYAGRALARRLLAKGEDVASTTTSDSKITTLRALGTEPLFLDPDRPETYQRALRSARVVVHLAPPPTRESIEKCGAGVDQVAVASPGVAAMLSTWLVPSRKRVEYGASAAMATRFPSGDQVGVPGPKLDG